MPADPCKHLHFTAWVDVQIDPEAPSPDTRLLFAKIECKECGVPFQFIQMGAATSLDGKIMSIHICPEGRHPGAKLDA